MGSHTGSQPYYLAGAILSLVSAIVVVVSYIKLPPVRKHPSGIIFYRSLLDILFSVHMIALYGVDYSLYQDTYSGYCTAYAFFFQFCILSSQTLYFALVLDMSFAVLINPFGNPRSYMKYYLAMTAIMGVITATIMVTKNNIVYRPGLDICWIEPTTTRGSVNGYNWGLLFGIITFYYVFAIVASLIVLLRLSQGSGKLFKTRSQTNERFVYVAVFTAYWTVAGALYARIYLLESDITCTEFCPEYDEHSSLYRAFAFVISVRGLVDAVVWILNQRVVFFAIEAYRRVQEERSIKPAEPAFSPSSLAGPRTGYFKGKHSRKRSMSLQQQVEEDLNKTLRAELLHFATSGVCDALDLANSQTRTAIYNPDTHSEHFVDDVEVERPENLAYPRSLFQEYGFCCSSQSRDRDAAIKRIDVRFTSRGSIRHRNSHATQGAATIERGDLVFLDYAPQVFRFLRRRFGIDDNELKKSITGDDIRESGEERMTELFTEGAGGSFFYFTRDKKYIIKTLTRRESSFLLKILRPYAMYMSSYPDTFITKFLGFYSVRQTMTLEPLYFVVMQSVFWNVPASVKIHTRYDLKGSYINRNAKGRGAASSLLLDNDLKHKLALQPDHRDKFRQQVSSDAKFLASLDVMDYSLLVGVHNSIWATNSSASRKQTQEAKHARNDSHTPFHQSIDGGMEAAYIKGPGVYVVGIIDILQEWDFAKKLEHYFKVYIRRKDREGISAIPPRPYCERFINSMHNVTEADELDTRELLLLQERNKGTTDQRSMTTVTRLSVESRASTKDRLPGLPLPSTSIPIPAPAGSARSSVNPSPRQHHDASPETGSLRKSGMFGSPDATLADPSFAHEEAPRTAVDSPSSGSRAALDRDTVVIELQTSSTSEANLAI